MEQHFHASGKLLLSGEYFVLDGALALAVPTSRGQKMIVGEGEPGFLHWMSYSEDGELWFEGHFDLDKIQCRSKTDEHTVNRLLQLIQGVQQQKPGFWSSFSEEGLLVSTHLEFPRRWGLGSSSTLISLLAQWSGVNPYTLLDGSFGGSGYDLACAGASGPIFYQKKDGRPHFVEAPFYPSFSENLYFVYLEKKQNSREGIARYREKVKAGTSGAIRKISHLTLQMAASSTLSDWDACVEEHEKMVSTLLNLPRAKELYFEDFPGTIKSLGAWGGDFVLASSEMDDHSTQLYFKKLGFSLVMKYENMVKKIVF